jgi:hypothetical protein
MQEFCWEQGTEAINPEERGEEIHFPTNDFQEEVQIQNNYDQVSIMSESEEEELENNIQISIVANQSSDEEEIQNFEDEFDFKSTEFAEEYMNILENDFDPIIFKEQNYSFSFQETVSNMHQFMEMQKIPKILKKKPKQKYTEQRLYEGSKLQQNEAYLLLLKIFLKHKLTRAASEDFLQAFKCFLPENDENANKGFPSSWHNLKKHFLYTTSMMYRFDYCESCEKLFALNDEICSNCQTVRFKSHKSKGIDYKMKKFFLMQDLHEAISEKFQNPEFCSMLQSTLLQRKINTKSTLNDIYDGRIYQEQIQSGNLGKKNQISFSFNTDGISPFQKSTVTIWPIYLVINELPINHRFKMENVILLGLWFARQKPNMNSFLAPVVQMINEGNF